MLRGCFSFRAHKEPFPLHPLTQSAKLPCRQPWLWIISVVVGNFEFSSLKKKNWIIKMHTNFRMYQTLFAVLYIFCGWSCIPSIWFLVQPDLESPCPPPTVSTDQEGWSRTDPGGVKSNFRRIPYTEQFGCMDFAVYRIVDSFYQNRIHTGS